MSRNGSAVLVHQEFDGIWPFAAEHWQRLWERSGAVELVRLNGGATRPFHRLLQGAEGLRRLALLGFDLEPGSLATLPALREIGLLECELGEEVRAEADRRGIRVYRPTSEGYWGQSVAEFALALTLAALRRIPQTHRQMIADLSAWDYRPPPGGPRPGGRGSQFGDDPRFANGTVDGKRVRIVGAGNIGSRYAGFCRMLGADVAAWDPFALPRGCLVVLATRAGICDMAALRRRVLAGELALAADVFDVEPLPLDDPLLGRDNVVHTPHNAGRTVHANQQLV